MDSEWILDLTVVSSFIVASVAGRARSFLKGCRHARVPQPSPSVDTICSSPFWDRCLIGLQLVQNCYALIASWLAYDKSDGLKDAVQPVLYRVGAASLRPRCSVLSLYFELLYSLKLIRTKIQVCPTTRNNTWLLDYVALTWRPHSDPRLIKGPLSVCPGTDTTTLLYWYGTVLGSQLLRVIKDWQKYFLTKFQYNSLVVPLDPSIKPE